MPAANNISELLELEQIDDFRFRASYHQLSPRKFLFGGQLLAQAMIAAQKTVPGRPAHSLNASFIRGGKSDAPLYFEVEATRDSRSFSTRRVVASSKDKVLFSAQVSFHEPEEGYSHQLEPGDLPAPPEDSTIETAVSRYREVNGGCPDIESPLTNLFYCVPCPETPLFSETCTPANGRVWIRSRSEVLEDTCMQLAVLSCASDLGLANTALYPHPSFLVDHSNTVASLDHSIWFHAPVNVNEWLLYVTDSPWAGKARGLTRGLIYNRSGKLVASTAQETLIRPS